MLIIVAGIRLDEVLVQMVVAVGDLMIMAAIRLYFVVMLMMVAAGV